MTDKLFKQFKKHDKSQSPNTGEVGGILGLPVDAKTVDVPNRNSYVYVRLRNTNEIIQVHNDKVNSVYDLPVIIKWENGKYNIVRRDSGRYQNWGGDSSYLPKHGGQHSLLGGDPTWVYSRQFLPFATMPSGTAGAGKVYIQPHVYRDPADASWNYVGNQYSPDLLPYKPSGTSAQIILLYWDLNTDSVGVSVGTTLVVSATGTAAILPALPLLTSQSQVPLAGIRLVSGTTEIGWDNIYDVRQFATTTPPAFAGGFGVQDEGVSVGTGTILNFVGDNVSATISGSVVRVYVTGSVGGMGTPDFTLWSSDAPPVSGSAYDDEFNNSSFDTGLWTELDVAGTLTESETILGLEFPAHATDSSVQGIYQDAPDSDWSIMTKVSVLHQQANDIKAGLMLIQDVANPSTSDILYHVFSVGAAGTGVTVEKFNAYNSHLGVVGAIASDKWVTTMYLRIRSVSGNWYFDWSTDGVGWINKQDWLANGATAVELWTPTGFGLCIRGNSTAARFIFHWFRYSTNAGLTDAVYGDRIGAWRV